MAVIIKATGRWASSTASGLSSCPRAKLRKASSKTTSTSRKWWMRPRQSGLSLYRSQCLKCFLRSRKKACKAHGSSRSSLLTMDTTLSRKTQPSRSFRTCRRSSKALMWRCRLCRSRRSKRIKACKPAENQKLRRSRQRRKKREESSLKQSCQKRNVISRGRPINSTSPSTSRRHDSSGFRERLLRRRSPAAPTSKHCQIRSIRLTMSLSCRSRARRRRSKT